MDIWLLAILSILNWLHLLGTVLWIGGMAINMLVLLPSMKEALEPAVAGKLLGAIMKRFRLLVYGSFVLLLFSGVVMTVVNKNYLGLGRFDNPWTQVISIKHVFAIALILLAVYALEALAPKVAKLAAKGLSPELARLQRLQLGFVGTGLVLGLIILLLTGTATAISALP